MRSQLNIIMSSPHGFGTLICYIIVFQYIKSISTNTESQSFDYVTDSLLPPYSEDQLIEWKPKELGEPNPSDWPGEMGQQFNVPEDKQTYDKYFKIHEFNILASDRIALNRTLKDSRIPECLTKQYRKYLPSTSVIIVFHNEAFSTLLRTVHSVIKTSSNLLLEIILVDDASTKVYLRRQLEDYVNQLEVPVRVMRLGKRLGLIKARLLGSANAKGQVLTFLDSHCECNEGWLEPLLDRIAEDRTRVVCPIIDVIDDENFNYFAAGITTLGGFDWKIGFRWYNAPKRELLRRNKDRSLPLRSPTMSGGLFAIDRDFFNYIGKYDEGMIIWGAENLEFSFRVWTCGGSIEIVTCSRVGHVFRKHTPYTLPGGRDYIVWHNTARLVDVWLDEWNNFYFALHPGARKIDRGNIDDRVLLRKQRQCKPFRWYLENIYPESQLPRDYYYLGDIRPKKAKNVCLDSEKNILLYECLLDIRGSIPMHQLFLYTKQNQILNDENCLEATALNQTVLMKRCEQNKENQKWKYSERALTLTHMLTEACLEFFIDKETFGLILNECNGKRSQKWLLQDNFSWQSPTHIS